jgi:hypothetical protein
MTFNVKASAILRFETTYVLSRYCMGDSGCFVSVILLIADIMRAVELLYS